MMRSDAIAYPPPARAAAALLVAASRASLVAIAVLVLFPDAAPGIDARLANPLRLLRAVGIFSLAPGLAAWLLGRAFAVTLAVRDGLLVLEGRGRRIEVPCDAVDAVVPWRMPLPAAGVGLRLRSGDRLDRALQVADPAALADALADAGAPAHVRASARGPAGVYARSRLALRRRWYHVVLAYVVFPLVPAVPLFRLHQWIAYGGTFGEYWMFGLKAYLLGFAVFWATAAAYLLVYAAVLRAVLEPAVVIAAWCAPGRTPGTRRTVESVDRVLYYGGVCLFLLRLFLQS
jgi:apolipoprotein N-acyltransferase